LKQKRVAIMAIVGLIVVAVYAAVAALVSGRQGIEEAARPTTATRAVQLPSDIAPTAMELYPQIEETARVWQSDAQLIGVVATWTRPTEADLLTKQPNWAFYFHSLAAGQTYLVTADESGTRGAPDNTTAFAPEPIALSAWKVDSAEALVTFLEHGGRKFMTDQFVTTAQLRLSASLSPGKVVWMVAGLSSTRRTAMSVVIDASTGAVDSVAPGQ
jgi:hypothetical protein